MTEDERNKISHCCYEINCQMMDWCDFHYRDMPAMRDTKTEPCDRVIEYYNNKNRTGDVN